MNREKLRSRLKSLSQQVVENSKGQRLSELRHCFEQICDLHKETGSEKDHQEIRALRDECREAVSKASGKKERQDIETDLAVQELQAEGVAFLKSVDDFLSTPREESEIQARVGIGIEIDDALERLQLPVEGLRTELRKANGILLGHQVQFRLDDLQEKGEFEKALKVIEDFKKLVGRELGESFFSDIRDSILERQAK